jgi:glycerophosphoryl diester phosphodiesterase
MVRSPLIIGHRGASAKAPENTLSAFRMALDSGADGIEFDVRLTRDDVPVVIHDSSLKRTGGCNVRVAELSLAELKEIDVGSWFDTMTHTLQRDGTNSTSFAKERVPTLEEVFQLFEPTNHLLYLEMKCDPHERDKLAKACCDFLRGSSMKHRVIVECFDLQGIDSVKNVDCDIKTAALFEPSLRIPPSLPVSSRIINQARAVKADEIALHHRLVNRRMIDAARNSKLQVVVWTVDDISWVKRASSDGITALITNDPEIMVRQRDIEAHAVIRVE